MKKSLNIVFALVCSTTLFFVGCRKKETTEVDNETQSAVDNAVADQEYAAIVPTTNSHAINTKGAGANDRLSSSAAPCDTLKWLNRVTSYTTSTGFVYPKADTTLLSNNTYSSAPVYELDLATTCANSFVDGKTRSGKWLIRITGPLRLAGSKMIMKLQNHKTIDAVASKTISYACDSIVVSTVASSTVFPSFTKYNIKLTGGICQTAAWNIKYNFDRTITTYPKGKTAGGDPVTEVFGTANGVNREGRAFTINIPQSSVCIKHKSCQFIDKGTLELTPDGFKTRTVDFGNGTCDDNATFTVNGNTVAFKLK
jgi:hypothetical protein